MTTASEKSCGDTTAAIATWAVESNLGSRGGTRRNFKTAFCARFECSQDNFEQRVFWKTMHPEARPVALLIRLLRPKFFQSDLDCIRNLAGADTKQEVRSLLNALQYDPAFKCGFFRGFLRVRISGRRLTRLAAKVLNGDR
jgi:hypothetical protein